MKLGIALVVLAFVIGKYLDHRGWVPGDAEMEASILGAFAILFGLAPWSVARPRRWLFLTFCLPIAAGLAFATFAVQQVNEADLTFTIFYSVLWASLFGAGLVLDRRLRRESLAAPAAGPRKPRRK